MSAIPFDTFQYVETLKTAGVSEKQAHAMLQSQQIFAEALVTKTDFLPVKHDVEILKHDVHILKHDVHILKQDVSALKIDVREVRSELVETRAELKGEITGVKHEVNIIKWVLGFSLTTQLSGMSALILKAFF